MYYIKPTILSGTNSMRIFQEEIFGPVTLVTTLKTLEEAVEIANNVDYGEQCTLTWTFHSASYHSFFSAFGGYKKSGFRR